MSSKAPAWVVPVMRTGYAARGAVYTVVGGLALLAAYKGHEAEGTTSALATLRDETWGIPMLWAIAFGLVAYTVWRLIDAAMDLETHGSDAKGIIARTGQVVTGLIHGGIGISVAGLALGQSSGGEKASDWTAKVMTLPYGPWLVIAAGLVIVSAGIFYVHKGVVGRYKRSLRETSLTERLDPVIKFGFIAHGAVVALTGAMLIYAGFTTDPQQAGGIGEALQHLRSVAYGRVLLGVVALGLMSFAVANLVGAVYRVVPARAGPDIRTLAMQARAKAEQAVS
ncbi:DUF1206 domain-containing protein [Puniceibacterium confluentis]|uniref:DUF1206 domain-containing protein n=1 Tax=Puniceibacterium confluentis TaxID=1958944 RepID=UPI0035655559